MKNYTYYLLAVFLISVGCLTKNNARKNTAGIYNYGFTIDTLSFFDPISEEQKSWRIKIIKLPNTIHNDMNDKADSRQRDEINSYIISFLNDM